VQPGTRKRAASPPRGCRSRRALATFQRALHCKEDLDEVSQALAIAAAVRSAPGRAAPRRGRRTRSRRARGERRRPRVALDQRPQLRASALAGRPRGS
jgi:hypothetical protein